MLGVTPVSDSWGILWTWKLFFMLNFETEAPLMTRDILDCACDILYIVFFKNPMFLGKRWNVKENRDASLESNSLAPPGD